MAELHDGQDVEPDLVAVEAGGDRLESTLGREPRVVGVKAEQVADVALGEGWVAGDHRITL